ncbi:PqqD family protein, partial [Candidatus Bathyarchaeota archaeon]
MTSKKKNKLPTTEEFLQYKPKRLDFEWFTNEEGLVGLK